jgi:hypothetical protein
MREAAQRYQRSRHGRFAHAERMRRCHVFPASSISLNARLRLIAIRSCVCA